MMRRLLRVVGMSLLAGGILAACAPASTPPRSPVGRMIWRIQNPPPATATPNVVDRMCLEAYAEHAADLPAEFIDQVAAVAPITFDPMEIIDIAIEAGRALDIPQSEIATTSSDLLNGDRLVTVQWCAPYSDQEVFLVAADQQVAHLLTIKGDRSIGQWAGEQTVVVWAHSGGEILRTQQIWIAEQQSDGTWKVVYEQSRMVSAASGFPSEITFGPHGATLDYTLPSGERVIRKFQVSSSGEWTLISEDRIEPK